MSNGQHDPVKDWLVQTSKEIFGDSSERQDKPLTEGQFWPVSPFAAAASWCAVAPPAMLTAQAANTPALAEALARLHEHQWQVIPATAALIGWDISRFLSRRTRMILAAHTRQATRHEPERVSVSFPPGLMVTRRATVKLPTGSIIRPKEYEEFSTAVGKSLVRQTKISRATRRLLLAWLAKRYPNLAQRRSGDWTITVSHDAGKDLLVVTRKLTGADTRSPRLKSLEKVIADGPLKDPTIAVETRDDDGTETGYRIGFTPTLNTGSTAFQKKIEEALAALAGEHESGRNWVTRWKPDEGYFLLTLQAPLPKRANHPLELLDDDLRHLPYAVAAADELMFWDVSTKSNKPHCLIVGPTGGGKTSVIRTLLTEAARRGIPFVGVDPKMIELDGLEGYPGCGAIVYDPLRAAMLVRALHAEMMARNNYVHVKKIEPSQLPLLIAVLDEFFILSGKWQRLMKTGSEETRKLLAELDPLGAWADLAVLARSAGIRLLLGVQRPDAQLFGNSSGNARDNFGTRISLGNLSQDGALMMWGDAQIGRDVDTSIPGRGMVTAPDGSPAPAQMWWTPNVDRHPNKWDQLSADEQALINGLAPQEVPQFTCYSRELREFLESERALAEAARAHGDVEEPVVLGDYRAARDAELAAADDDLADAVPASAITEGMTFLLDHEDGELVPVVAEGVTVIRDKAGDVLETRIVVAVDGRVKTTVVFEPRDVVFLPAPDSLEDAA
ncbi:FtsK/SpoIIIE domain-containing protein [Nocardia tengchongensis]|uniref:FtsK/SpoIIIE domain-containing protein n=1 Tax=Nocardia tengchongensis TaxID=2055889 RepID=UPI00365452B4